MEINQILKPQCDFFSRDFFKRDFHLKQWFLKESDSSMPVLGGPTIQVFYISIFSGLILAIGYVLFAKYGDFFGFMEETEEITPQPEVVQRIIFSVGSPP